MNSRLVTGGSEGDGVGMSCSRGPACPAPGVIAVAVLCQLTVPGVPVAQRLRLAARGDAEVCCSALDSTYARSSTPGGLNATTSW